MLAYPTIDPVAISLGPLKIHWYGLMYVVGFFAAWGLGTYRAKQIDSGWTSEQLSDVLFYAALGVILGGRLGYVLVYGLEEFFSNPLFLFKIWQGGMSFHGGLLGVVLAVAYFSRQSGKSFSEISDFIAPLVPLGLAAGRIGNFINAELWGRVSTAPWAMVFPNAGPYPRHPSQLYEALLEGLCLFALLWWYSAKPRPRLRVSALFLLGYGAARLFVEFFRQPDPQLGYLAFNWLTMGQLLSLPMLLLGVYLWCYSAYRLNKE